MVSNGLYCFSLIVLIVCGISYMYRNLYLVYIHTLGLESEQPIHNVSITLTSNKYNTLSNSVLLMGHE